MNPFDYDDNMPTSATIFCLQRYIRYCTLRSERFGCTLVRNVMLACNKPSDIAR